MKTVLLSYKDGSGKTNYEKKYAFNTDADLKVGERLKNLSKGGEMKVVNVFGESFKYFNSFSGDLSNTLNNTNQFEIKELVLRDDSKDIVYASKVLETLS